jgi:hypothetical protein
MRWTTKKFDIPDVIDCVKLIRYTPDKMSDIISAAMYFNTKTAQNQKDSFLDRVTQAKALVNHFRQELIAKLQNEEDESDDDVETPLVTPDGHVVKKPRKKKKDTPEDFTHTAVVAWLGVRAAMLSEGEQFTSKNAISVGVVVRIARMANVLLLNHWQVIACLLVCFPACFLACYCGCLVDKQTDRQADRQTDTHTHSPTLLLPPPPPPLSLSLSGNGTK